MNKLSREEFSKRLLMLVAGTALVPKFLKSASFSFAANAAVKNKIETAEIKINEFAIIDMHCHPSLKPYLWDIKFWRRHHFRGPGDNLLAQQEDVHEFTFGNVKGIIAAHYLPEGGIKRYWTRLKLLWPVLRKIAFNLTDKIEHEDDSNFTQINNMIDLLETQIHIANEKQSDVKFVIARSYAEFEEAITQGNIPIAHSIEGAHALGRNKPYTAKKLEKWNKNKEQKMSLVKGADPNADLYVRNMKALKARGVCMITLAHFFPNDLAFPVEGISPHSKNTTGMQFCYDPAKDDLPLHDIGKKVVEEMLEAGMIVDLTHSTPKARRQVFEINRKRKDAGKEVRPITFTHTGSQVVFEKYDNNQYPNYKYYCVDATDIKEIEECKGVIGVIPENFWLTGADIHSKKCGINPHSFKLGIKYIIETLQNINSQTEKKDYDNVAIGTDFDGLADNPKDMFLNRHLSDLIIAMQKEMDLQTGKRVFEDKHIKKICFENAQRLLITGWV